MSYVAAFRAYEWNDCIAMLAARFFAATPGARHVVLMNEERGPIDVGAHEKVAHGSDFSDIGLPDVPAGRSLWFNGDYAYGHLRRVLPGYEHYVIAESDVAVNLSLAPMMEKVVSAKIDLVVHELRPCLPSWPWFDAASAQPNPVCAGLFIFVASGRALDALLTERLRLAAQLRADPSAPWPIVESFVATTVWNAGMRIGEIGEFADTDHLKVGPALSVNDPAAHRPGSLVHPVLSGPMLLRRLLSPLGPAEYRRPGAPHHDSLRFEPFSTLAAVFWDAFEMRGDHRGLAELREEMLQRGLPVPQPLDLAWCKPATVSSICQWSATQDPEEEATRANGRVFHDICAFHTGEEADAWWRVDLLERQEVQVVEIVNRADFGERFQRFVIETALSGDDWTVVSEKDDDRPVSGDAAFPWRVVLGEPVACRFVRIRRLGPPGFLHLRRVRIFGPQLLPQSLAETVEAPPLSARAVHG
ncbi:discoidin domain-containing protein [Acetobacteraceae bacterium KSS8]|uniref:Discoidin domain-containing protein n=1 Tax=Endosaccharibacter trunci TaxID=2812733 RepID=A0ABT1W866_9PROT|nr:discoidin domain-containing protein [Acetobacteraceae bacterium KSS8]